MESIEQQSWVSGIMPCYDCYGTMLSDALRCVDSSASFGWTFTLGKLGFISRARGESILQGRAAKTLADAILEPEVD